MREQITIDVVRTRGSRHARVRVFVAPVPGEAGCAYTVGSVDLGSHGQLDREVAAGLGGAIIDMLERQIEFAQLTLEF